MVEAETIEEERTRVKKDVVGKYVVVENVPQVGPEKYEKLKKVLTPILSRCGALGEKGVELPQGEDGSALGYAIVQYQSPAVATKAIPKITGYKLDASHEFAAITLEEVKHLKSMPDEPPPVPNPASDERVDLPAWLGDSRSREQFAVVHENCTIDIHWYDSIAAAEQNYQRVSWTDSRAMWSWRGTYLATFHVQGIVLWGGPKWERIRRFPHANVQLAEFSRNETYLVTWNGLETPPGEENVDRKCVIVWEVATGRKMRFFPVSPNSRGELPSWPIFKWSHDDAFFGRLGEDLISVYTTPSMGLLDKKSIKIPRVQAFEWSTSDPIIAYWTPEEGDAPARVGLMELPSRKELRQLGLYSVESIRLQWKEDGNFLSCRVVRFTKNRKVQYTNFVLFHMRDKDYPVDILDFKEKELVEAFEWEPKGNRFAVIHGDPPKASNVSFYSMESTSNGKLKHLFTVDKKSFNTVLWSPAGALVVLARLGNPHENINGSYEWYNVNEQELIGAEEHYSATDMKWDPSGRYVCSYTAFQQIQVDNGYIIYNISGKILHTESMDKLYQFLWRPRPPLLLSPDQEKTIRKNIKKYRDRYEAEDEELKAMKASGKAAKFRQLREEWKEYMSSREDELERVRQWRLDVFGDPEDPANCEVIEEVFEEVVDVQEEEDKTRKMLNSEDERD